MIRLSELHELNCPGPAEGCVCISPKLSVLPDRGHAPPDDSAGVGVDMHLSSLETLMIALEQRRLTEDQLDRFARILQYGERVALSRVRGKRR